MKNDFILDAGCGSGIARSFNPYWQANVFMDIEKPPRRIGNFVVGDVNHLPFRNNIFSEVHCNHVLEHLENPIVAIKELIRTSSDMVLIRVPHRFSVNAKADKTHISFFNKTWFARSLRQLGVLYRVEAFYSPRPKYLPIFNLPHEIKVTIHKEIRE